MRSTKISVFFSAILVLAFMFAEGQLTGGFIPFPNPLDVAKDSLDSVANAFSKPVEVAGDSLGFLGNASFPNPLEIARKTLASMYRVENNLETNEKRYVQTVSHADGNITYCNIFGDRKIIEKLLKGVSDANKIKRIESTEMDALIDACQDLLTLPESILLHPSEFEANPTLFGLLIFPGTKWCGPGSVARNITDLGRNRNTDVCCRAHDFCTDNIPSGESKYGLNNTSFYTKSNCSCDDVFYKCLQKSNSLSSNSVGFLYFNFVRIECFTYDYPIVKCSEYASLLLLLKSCQKYVRDTTSAEEWQFNDPKYYHTKIEDSDIMKLPHGVLTQLSIIPSSIVNG